MSITFYTSQVLMNAVMEEDIDRVLVCCKENPEWMDLLSPSQGLAPIHVAIYLRNCKILRTLLKKGADPNLKDVDGNTPAHCAVKIGFLDGLKLLYETKKCQLSIISNNTGYTALDISKMPLDEAELEKPFNHMFGDWNPAGYRKSVEDIIDGRTHCYQFILQIMENEYNTKRIQVENSMITNNADRQYKTSIIRGATTISHLRYISRVDYVKAGGQGEWDETDVAFFNQHADDVTAVRQTVFVRDKVRKYLRSGFENVQLQGLV